MPPTASDLGRCLENVHGTGLNRISEHMVWLGSEKFKRFSTRSPEKTHPFPKVLKEGGVIHGLQGPLFWKIQSGNRDGLYRVVSSWSPTLGCVFVCMCVREEKEGDNQRVRV